ncbi:Cof-type HAD-IIB family hydrolase [Paenibacillus sp. GCM10012303]|jgi:Cof subfamily protein (haloacid dehalogenase superfamily)|uniref:Cof-type HAD-IIB family hydrolase n=1 Tax=Paenibacillus sp. GCM10012303 TaxID=3317340 RepID=UPI00361DCEB5
MSGIQAIVLDLDGTLLDSSKSISPRNYRAVKQCFEAGIHIIVATARPPRVAKHFIKDLPFAEYLVFYNGALVTNESKQVQRHICIPTEISQQIIKLIELSEPHSTIYYEVNDSWYTCTPIPDSESAKFDARSGESRPEVVDSNFICSLSPTKILVVGYSSWNELARQFGNQVNVIATDEGVLVQIMHKSASKEDAVQWVLNEIGMSPDHVMVFGDDFNDLGLFHKCGFPIAMGNGITELKNCAKYVTESNDNDGVAAALEKFVLNQVNNEERGIVSKEGENIRETNEIITVNVYKTSPDRKEVLERQAGEKVEKAREEALTKIRERYEQRKQSERRRPASGGELEDDDR